MPDAACARIIAISGVMPLPAARNSQAPSGVCGRVISPNAGPSVSTSPILAVWHRCWLSLPPGIALTVMAMRPSARGASLRL